jgi:hypothetical protein
MRTFIILFSAFIIAMAGAMALRPKQFTDALLRHARATWLHVLAAGTRIAIGLALVLYAEQSGFPRTLTILGWFAIAAGAMLALVPPSKFERLIRWSLERFGKFNRVAALFAVIFGGFLIYAVL